MRRRYLLIILPTLGIVPLSKRWWCIFIAWIHFHQSIAFAVLWSQNEWCWRFTRVLDFQLLLVVFPFSRELLCFICGILVFKKHSILIDLLHKLLYNLIILRIWNPLLRLSFQRAAITKLQVLYLLHVSFILFFSWIPGHLILWLLVFIEDLVVQIELSQFIIVYLYCFRDLCEALGVFILSGVSLMGGKFCCSYLFCFVDDVGVIPRVFLICIQILHWISLFGLLVWFSSWLTHFGKQIAHRQVLLFTILFQIKHSWLLHDRFNPLRRLQEEMRRWHMRFHRLLPQTFVDLADRRVHIVSILFAATSHLVLILLLLLYQFNHILMFRFCLIWVYQI